MNRDNLPSNITIDVPQLSQIRDSNTPQSSQLKDSVTPRLYTLEENTIQTTYTGVLHIDWKSHALWFLSVACFILARLWWLIPLPGDSFLPSYRTYPATFLNNLFLTLACGLAGRSLPVGLIDKPFTNGIHPDSVVSYGTTGGYAAMWSGIRHRSGIRYFLLAFMVTAATLLGNALEGELQSSITIRYVSSHSLSNMNALECQHSTSNDYQTASNAYANQLITHSLMSAPMSLLSNYAVSQPIPSTPYSLSIYQTTLTPIHNISFSNLNTNLRKRHHKTTTICQKEDVTAAPAITSTTYSSTGSISEHATSTTSSPETSPTITTASSNTFYQPQSYAQVTLDGHQYAMNTSSDFNNTLLSIYKNGNAYYTNNNNSAVTAIKLNVLGYTTPDNKAVVIIYSAPSDGIIAGVYIAGQTTNYTCHETSCYPAFTGQIKDVERVADALVKSIQSNVGYYGTATADSLVVNLLNNQQQKVQDQSKLVDALYTNPNCPAASTFPSQGYLVMPYSAAHWTILGVIWIALFALLYLIGAYLIGYSEESWSSLVRTGYMIPQVVHNSNGFFVNENSGKVTDQTTYLDQSAARFSFIKEHHHGYTVTSEVVYDS